MCGKAPLLRDRELGMREILGAPGPAVLEYAMANSKRDLVASHKAKGEEKFPKSSSDLKGD